MISKINKIVAAGLMICGLAACGNDDERIPNITPAMCPSAISMQIPADMQKLIYTDNTGADVLPMIVGETVTLGYSLEPAEATYDDVVWSTSEATVASVDNGTVTALSEKGLGYSIVTVAPTGMFSGSGVLSTLKVKVVERLQKATAILLTAADDEIYEGEKTSISYELEPEATTYRTLAWTSSDPSVATVDSKGIVTGVSVGDTGVRKTVTITAEALDGSGVTASVDITIKRIVQPENVTLDQKFSADNGYYCAINERTLKLEYTTLPEEATNSLIEWTTSDENIATVKDGIVTFNTTGDFGDVTITATCPETGNSSSIRLNLAAGLFRETFHNPDHYSWYNSSQSGNGTASSHEWHDGYVTITTYTVNETTQRGDIKCWEAHTWLHAGNYPILAFRMDDVREIGEGITTRNINVDCSGKSQSGKEYKALGNGNNKWKHLYELSDGSYVFIYDLSTQSFGTGGLMPKDEVVNFTTFQVKYADMKKVDHQIKYNLYWVQTFKSMDDLHAYIAGEGLEYEVMKSR